MTRVGYERVGTVFRLEFFSPERHSSSVFTDGSQVTICMCILDISRYCLLSQSKLSLVLRLLSILWSIKVSYFCFRDNFVKCGTILIVHSLLHS